MAKNQTKVLTSAMGADENRQAFVFAPHSTVSPNANMNPGDICFQRMEGADKVVIVVKYDDGTVKAGTVNVTA